MKGSYMKKKALLFIGMFFFFPYFTHGMNPPPPPKKAKNGRSHFSNDPNDRNSKTPRNLLKEFDRVAQPVPVNPQPTENRRPQIPEVRQ